jgi:hypothetical protein
MMFLKGPGIERDADSAFGVLLVRTTTHN